MSSTTDPTESVDASACANALPAALPGLDVTAGLARLANDERAYRQILSIFMESKADAARNLRGAAEAGDEETLQRLAHTMKGVAGRLYLVSTA